MMKRNVEKLPCEAWPRQSVASKNDERHERKAAVILLTGWAKTRLSFLENLLMLVAKNCDKSSVVAVICKLQLPDPYSRMTDKAIKIFDLDCFLKGLDQELRM